MKLFLLHAAQYLSIGYLFVIFHPIYLDGDKDKFLMVVGFLKKITNKSFL